MRSILLALAIASSLALGACSGGSSGGGGGRGSSGGGGTSGGGTSGGSRAPSVVPGGATGPAAAPAPGAIEGRALWVTRWQCDTDAKVRAAVDFAAAKNLNMLLLQVYGDGAALYPSAVAPRNSLTSGSGFDPLAAAVPYAHARGIEVHAWMNVVRVYHGGNGAPSNPQHVLRLHPDWTMVDVNGIKSTDRYSVVGAEIFACPERQGFHDYCVAVAREIAANYDVDGVHLDYIRLSNGTSWCYCDAHLANFQARYGRAPTASDPDWRAFRFETITRLVSSIHDAIGQVRPRARLSAATTRFFSFQDPREWFHRGKLDIQFPMLYTSDVAAFEALADAARMASNGRLVMPGIGVANGKIAEETGIARDLACQGVAFFSSSEFDASHDPILAAAFPAPAAIPDCPWKDGTPDRTPPRLGPLTVLPGQDEATIEWSTDEETEGRVELAPAGGAFAIAAGPGGFGWDHRAIVRNLAPGTSYVFHVVATDRAGNWRSSVDATFATQAAGPVDVIVDDGDPGYSETGSWNNGSSAGGNGADYRYAGRAASATASATFRPALPRSGRYRVSTWYVQGTNRVPDAPFEVRGQAGGAAQTVAVNQQTGGGAWVPLGEFRFDAGTSGAVVLTNASAAASGVVIADAVRFEYVGP